MSRISEGVRTMNDTPGIRIQSVSLGKGLVCWQVQFPPLARKNNRLIGEYQALDDLLVDVRRFCSEDQVDQEVIDMMKEREVSEDWGSGL